MLVDPELNNILEELFTSIDLIITLRNINYIIWFCLFYRQWHLEDIGFCIQKNT